MTPQLWRHPLKYVMSGHSSFMKMLLCCWARNQERVTTAFSGGKGNLEAVKKFKVAAEWSHRMDVRPDEKE